MTESYCSLVTVRLFFLTLMWNLTSDKIKSVKDKAFIAHQWAHKNSYLVFFRFLSSFLDFCIVEYGEKLPKITCF